MRNPANKHYHYVLGEVLIITTIECQHGLAADYIFQPIAVETLGPINESASDFFSLLAKKISHHSGDERETAFFVPARFRASAASDSTACCYMIPLCLRTARSNGHSDTFSSNFFPNPSGSLIPRVQKNNIKVIALNADFKTL